LADVSVLAAAAIELQQKSTLESVLQLLVERSADVLGVRRVSVRLIDRKRRLLTRGRAGDAWHGGEADFAVGEGLIGWIAANARPLRLAKADSDLRFVERPGRRGAMGAFLGVPLLADRHCLGVVSALHQQTDYFTAEHEEVLTVLAAVAAPHVELARLRRLTQLDPLTGVLNRHGLELVFPELSSGPLCVGMIDIDHFKRVNDAHGHLAGDQVLRHVSSLLARELRATDAVVRYGGEEFVVVLPGATLIDAERVLQRARAAVAEAAITIDGRALGVTVSAGVAARRGAEARHALIARADAALYDAKRAGRNCVRTST
jgi:diguanylate cyclase (GGDEF)-like protein